MPAMTKSSISPVSKTPSSTETSISIVFTCIKAMPMEIDAPETIPDSVAKLPCRDHLPLGCTALQEKHLPMHGNCIWIVDSKFPTTFAICIKSS